MARWCPFCCIVHFGLVIRYDVINTGYTIFSLFVALCVKFDPGTHKGMHSVLALKPGVTTTLVWLMSHLIFKPKPNAHSMCAQESSLHTYRIENGYRITNVTIYNIFTE
jgi:hypothetical protein